MTQLDARARIIEAAYACVARYGLAKTTVDDAAREAGLSRATLYRYFPGGRDELVRAVVTWETMRFFGRLYEVLAGIDDLEEVVATGITYAHQAADGHAVFQKVLQTEPELLLARLTVESGRVIDMVAAFLRPYVERHMTADRRQGQKRAQKPAQKPAQKRDASEASAFIARMILSVVVSPGDWDLDDPAQVRRLVRTEVLAGMTVEPSPGGRAGGHMLGPGAPSAR